VQRMPLTPRLPLSGHLALFLAALCPILGCASSAAGTSSRGLKPDASDPVERRSSVVVAVSPTDDSRPSAFVDEEYISLLSTAIDEQWHGWSRQARRPVVMQLVLGWDGRMESLAFRSRSGDPAMDKAALKIVIDAYTRVVTREFRLYFQEDYVKRRCLSCTATVTVTLKTEANE